MTTVRIERSVPTSDLYRFRERLREWRVGTIEIEHDQVRDVATVKASVPEEAVESLPEFDV